MDPLTRRTLSFLLAALTSAAAALPASARAPDVKPLLEAVPAEAAAFVVIPSLDELNDAINMLQTQVMGMAMTDALQMFTMQMGIEKGLDTKGGVAVIVLDPKKFPSDPIAVVFTTTNAEEFLGNFSPGEKEDGLTALDIQNEKFFARTSGKLVTIVKNKDVGKALLESKGSISGQISGPRLKMLGERLLTASAAAGKLLTVFKDEIGNFINMISAMSGGASNTKQLELALDQMRQFEWMDLSLAADKAGVQFTFVATAQGGSEVEKTLKETKTSATTLTGLPAGPYVVALGTVITHDAKTTESLKATFNSLVNTAGGEGEDVPADQKKAVKEMFDLLLDGFHLLDGVALTVSPLADGPDGLVAMAATIMTSDSDKLMQIFAKVIASAKKLGESNEEVANAMKMIEHKVAAETLGSVKVDHLAVNLSESGDVSEEDLSSLKKVIGGDGVRIRMGATDSKHVVLSLGGGKAYFSELAKATQSGGSALAKDAGIEKIGGPLPKTRTGEVYIAVDAGANLVKRITRAIGEDTPPYADFPPLNAPVAMVGSTEGNTVRFDVVIPMPVVTSVRTAVMGAMMGGAKPPVTAEKENGDNDKNGDEDGAKKDDGNAQEENDE